MSSSYVRATIRNVTKLSSTVRALSLEVEGASQRAFRFRPGQWVDLAVPGTDMVGGYSITSVPEYFDATGLFTLAVKDSKHPPARWVHTSAAEGVEVGVRVGGNFSISETFRKENSLFIAGGIGITPLVSMIELMFAMKADANEPSSVLDTMNDEEYESVKDMLDALDTIMKSQHTGGTGEGAQADASTIEKVFRQMSQPKGKPKPNRKSEMKNQFDPEPEGDDPAIPPKYRDAVLRAKDKYGDLDEEVLVSLIEDRMSQLQGVFTEMENMDEKADIAGGAAPDEQGSAADLPYASLLYSASCEEELLFKDELRKWCDRVVLTVTRESDSDWKGQKGRIDKELIQAALEDIKSNTATLQNGARPETIVYVCGPPKMTEHVVKMLMSLRVPVKNIRYEKWW